MSTFDIVYHIITVTRCQLISAKAPVCLDENLLLTTLTRVRCYILYDDLHIKLALSALEGNLTLPFPFGHELERPK